MCASHDGSRAKVLPRSCELVDRAGPEIGPVGRLVGIGHRLFLHSVAGRRRLEGRCLSADPLRNPGVERACLREVGAARLAAGLARFRPKYKDFLGASHASCTRAVGRRAPRALSRPIGVPDRIHLHKTANLAHNITGIYSSTLRRDSCCLAAWATAPGTFLLFASILSSCSRR